MLFNSLSFALFFPVVLLIYYALPTARLRVAMLIGASCYFYMAYVPAYIAFLVGLIAIDYTAGLLIGRQHQPRSRKILLLVSLAANLTVLGTFKYFNFFNETAGQLAGMMSIEWHVPNLGWALPIGLSFHTFQSISYVIEVYRGRQPPERNLANYALYVLFWPQLVAGPIERPQHLLPQFRELHRFRWENLSAGLKLMAVGLFKKVVIADRLAGIVGTVYGDPTHFVGLPLILATCAFALQIYCDFSGYSDMAIGAARTMGFSLVVNFDRPYGSHSIAEFWRRWHISLSTWFRDYVYIPLGGNRGSRARWHFNVLLTFLLSGLWHGANWTFLVWGGLNGLLMIVHNTFLSQRARTGPLLQRAVSPLVKIGSVPATFCLVCTTWVFFRAADLHSAWYVVTHMFGAFSFKQIRTALGNIEQLASTLGTSRRELLALCAATALMDVAHRVLAKPTLDVPFGVRLIGYSVLLWATLLLGRFEQAQMFIYFRF